ncbi:MAG: 16S rRNA (cytosine(1402)-N(4))-methyltransferase RsmH [Dehalococcoidia bacterium]|nr:16S rRNA (cytosine(1402)-N(4))-methyltransferase RsmH [Dehalococcoidia bacterium]
MTTATHIPVLLKETLEALAIQPGGRYVDCTAGGGGHAEAILQKSAPGGQLLGLDADPEAVVAAWARLSHFGAAALIVNDNFVSLESVCLGNDFAPVNGVLFDLGMSSLQLSESGRGFSFKHGAPLDMRFNPAQPVSAEDIVNCWSEADLARIIYEYGEEPHSRGIARMIVRSRPLLTTDELASVVERVVPSRGRIHPATRTFQALRIAVNQELDHLASALEQAVSVLGHGGRLVVISYHSLEDRIVKDFMRREAVSCVCPPGLPQCVCHHQPRLRIINRQVIIPTPAEEYANARSRSAKMRVAERIVSGDVRQEDAVRLKNPAGKGRPGGRRRPEKLRVVFNSN